jgi:GTP-binding protein HflX
LTGGSLQLFERPRGGERAILVGVGIGHPVDPNDTAEFAALAASAGTLVVGQVLASRARPDPKYFVGSGKAEEIRLCCGAHEADVVLVDQTLSPEPGTQPRETDRSSSIRP